MDLKKRIRKEIEMQKTIEGDSCQDEVLLKFLDAIKTQSQWNALIICKFYQYGKFSYENHRFYYPTKELLDFIVLIKS